MSHDACNMLYACVCKLCICIMSQLFIFAIKLTVTALLCVPEKLGPLKNGVPSYIFCLVGSYDQVNATVFSYPLPKM